MSAGPSQLCPPRTERTLHRGKSPEMEELGAILYPWHSTECHTVGALLEIDNFLSA